MNTTISWQELVELLDLDNMVDYTLFCLLLDASDNNYLNFFLLKTNDGCYVRIPWDLDRTLTRYRAYDDLWPSFSLPFEAASLLDKGADGFASLLSQRWDALRQSHFAQEALLSRLDALSYLITESGALAREHQRWREPDDLIPVERFQDYLPYRLSDLDAYLDQLSSHYALDMNPFRRPIE